MFLPVVFAIALVVAVQAGQRPSDVTPIGAVLTGVGEIDRSRPFIDLMKQARGFSSVQNPTDQNATIGPDLWPTSDFSVAFMTVGGGTDPCCYQYPAMHIGGVYTLIASGSAVVSMVNGSVGFTVLNQTYDPSGNTLTAFIQVDDVTNDGKMWVVFTDTRRSPTSSTGSGLVNVSLLLPGYTLQDAQTLMFNQAWIDHLARFSVVRFVGWTLNSTQAQYTWTDRPQLSSPSYLVGSYGSKGAGVPWEVIIRLANVLGADIWINIPVSINTCNYDSDECYLYRLAQLMATTLHPTSAVVCEYANEVWNGHFAAHNINEQLAYVSVQAGDPYGFDYDKVNNSDVWGSRRYAWMVKNIGDIFASVYPPGSVGPGKRVQTVLAGQGDDAALANSFFQYYTDVWGRPSTLNVSYLTIAPYFGLPNNVNNQTNLTVDQVLGGMSTELDSMDWNVIGYNGSNALAGHVALCVYHSIDMRGYEGGPATTGNPYPAALMAKAQASIDPRMSGLVRRLYDMWHGYGLHTLNIHQAGATTLYAPWGTFGVLYDLTVPVTPKTEGLDAVRTSPRPAINVGLPLPLLAHNYSLSIGYYGNPRTPTTWFPANATALYLLRLDPASRGAATHLNVTFHIMCTKPDVTLELSLGDDQVQVLTAPVTTNSSAYLPLSALFDLPPSPPVGQAQLMTLRHKVLTPQSYRISVIDAVPVA